MCVVEHTKYQKTFKWTMLGYNNFSQAIVLPQRRHWAQNRQYGPKNDPTLQKMAPIGTSLAVF